MDQETDNRIKIVIVEDTEALAEIYQIRLTAIGYHCFVAPNGEAALEIIEREKPALVLLDLMIPIISGDEVLRRMRASDWGKDIRVYVISNLNETEASPDLRQLGIEGYTVKANLSNDDIDNLVDRILTPADQEEGFSLEG
jgi:two-component system KDP operon response regulator KdpE